MTNKTLHCSHPGCKYQARSPLERVPGCRGVHETPAATRLCPHGHGPLSDALDPFSKREARNA
jgi:hypothetical protein